MPSRSEPSSTASPRSDSVSHLTPRTVVTCIFVAGAIALGGGGSSAPLSELALQSLAALTLAAWLIVPAGNSAESGVPPRALVLLAALVLALPALQLIPLPPALWQALPGREAEIAALALVGGEQRWMPWSMTPSRTLASLLSIVPPVLAMLMAASLDRDGRRRAIMTVAAMALASLLLGAMQLSSGSSGFWRLYGIDNLGYLNGFQANRNAQADVLLIGLAALVATSFAIRHRLGQPLALGLSLAGGGILVLGCILTGSRMGIMLVPVVLAFAIAIWNGRSLATSRLGWLALAGVGLALVGGLLLRGNAVLGRVLARFSLGRDFRLELWEDTRFAIAAHWPFGSGVGSFRPVLVAAERLEVVDPTMPVRAHNDYLELLLEGGIFGAALLLAGAVVLGYLLLAAWRRRQTGERPQILFAMAAIVVIALHSVVDYPLRSMALAVLAAFAVGILAACAGQQAPRTKVE